MTDLSRRDFLASLGSAALLPPIARVPAADVLSATREDCRSGPTAARGVIVRTITAGVSLGRLDDRGAVERALAMLVRSKTRFEREG